MTNDVALALTSQMLWLTLIVAGPIVGASMIVGLAVSILQVATQIQEMTLTFIPKLLVIFGLLLALGPWMLAKLVTFGTTLFERIPTLG